MLSFLEEKFKDIKFTKTEKIIADFLLKKGQKISFMTSKEIAEQLNISGTSVIRFVKALGFDNFSHFKAKIQQEVTKTVLTPTQKLDRNKDLLKSEKLVGSFIENISRQINNIFSDASLSTISSMSRILKKSNKKYIVGFKSVSGIASFLGLRLGFIMKDVYTFSENSSELLKQIIDIEKGDCLFLIAFPKYSKTLNLLIEIAEKKGASIIIVTDNLSSPVAYKGEVTLFIDTLGISYFNSIIPAQIFCEYLLTDLSKTLDLEGEERLKMVNSYLDLNVK